MLTRESSAMSADERAEIERQQDAESTGFLVHLTEDSALRGGLWLFAFSFGGLVLLGFYQANRGQVELRFLLSAMGLCLLLPALLLSQTWSGFRRTRTALRQKWEPVLSRGEVEVVSVEARAVVEVDSAGRGQGWFFDLGDGRLFFLFWPSSTHFPSSAFQVRWLPTLKRILTVNARGRRLEPVLARRRFEKREYQPEPCEVIEADFQALGRRLRALKRERDRRQLEERVARADWSGANQKLKALVDGIEPMGFYKYVPRARREAVKTEVLEGVWHWLRQSRRLFYADAEYLAEGGVKDLVEELRKVFAVEGVELQQLSEDFDPSRRRYSIFINGREYRLYTSEDSTTQSDAWSCTLERTLRIVNELLLAAASRERAYLAGEGELVILTPEMLRLLEASGVLSDEDLPGDFRGTSFPSKQ